MGNTLSAGGDPDTGRNVGRAQAVTEFKRRQSGRTLPVGSSKASSTDYHFITVSTAPQSRAFLSPPRPAAATVRSVVV